MIGAVRAEEPGVGAAEPPFPYTTFYDSPGSAHSIVVEHVPRESRVLEFGCATGYMSRVLKEERGCAVTGIELVPEAAEVAREHCDRVIVGDAEQLDYARELGDERFDVVLFADVLEHLREPAKVLTEVQPFVAEGGQVIASIPNVAHGSVRLALLGGEFRYRETGLLDRTHLRFFTRESILDLFEESGYVITNWHRARLDVELAEIAVPPRVEGVRELLGSDLEATTYQFVTQAVPAREPDLLRARDRAAALQDGTGPGELDALRQTLREQREQLDRLGDDLASTLERERELRALLVHAHDELLQKDEEIRRLTNELASVLTTRVWRWGTRAVTVGTRILRK
jgi:2-polyprenyl-3-methyl-5-hydroxy-6-metoxy-1,4-benzoquinol methylase